MKKRSIFLILIFFTVVLSSCKYDFILPVEEPEVNPGGDPVSFSSQVAPIFSNGNKCTECHKAGGQSPDLTAANAYSQIVPALINATTPNQSDIYAFPAPSTSKHDWRKYTATEAATVLKWIEEGAKNN